MIREFVEEDLLKIEFNEFSDKALLKELRPALKMYEGWTLEMKGIIKVILFYRNYADQNYEGFLVCSKYMNAFDGRNMRYFIHLLKEKLSIKRMETLSLDCKVINRWHKFLGFVCEGTKKQFMNNNDYKMWAIVS